jgi:hypothetical protein
MTKSMRGAALGCLALAPPLLGLAGSTAAAAGEPPTAAAGAPRSAAADPVFTADDFASRQVAPWDEQGRDITYPVKILEGLPVYRIRLIPDPAAAAADHSDSGGGDTVRHVGRAEISLAGASSVLQTIEVDAHRGTRSFTAWFTIADVNLDGYADLGFWRDGGAQWGSNTWWLFDPASGRFVRNALSGDLDRLASNGVLTDRSTGTLTAPYLSASCSQPLFDRFKIVDGRLLLVERHERQARYETEGICAVAVSKLIDGRLQQVELQKAPLTNY